MIAVGTVEPAGRAGAPDEPRRRTFRTVVTRFAAGWAGRAGRVARKARPHTTPAALRLLLLLSLLTTTGLFAAGGVTLGSATTAVREIGQDSGPQVVATADLYLALSDMDAQMARILLTGRETDLGIGREEAMARYEERRADAGTALLHAADLTGDDPTERATIEAVLDGLGDYERLAAEALVLNRQAARPAGPPPDRVIRLYREASDLMRLALLPKAYNLTLEGGTVVRRTYEEKRVEAATGRTWIAFTGAATVAILVGLQVYLARRFRRRINPALVAATAGAVVLTVVPLVALSHVSGELRIAKEEGFDAVLLLSRARAISTSMHADQSRYLLDPERADTYTQVYFEKSQSLLYVPVGSLRAYYPGVTDVAERARSGQEPGHFYGLLGDEARLASAMDGPSLRQVLTTYERFQHGDRRMRARANGGDQRGAVVVHLRQEERFLAYADALRSLIDTHRRVFETAVASADEGLEGPRLLPAVLAPAVLLLAVVGVWPRLREYR